MVVPSRHIDSFFHEDVPCMVAKAHLVNEGRGSVDVFPKAFAHRMWLFSQMFVSVPTHTSECEGQWSEIQDAKQYEQQQTHSFRVGEGTAHKTLACMCTLGISIAVVTASFDSLVSKHAHTFAMHKKAKRPFEHAGWKNMSRPLALKMSFCFCRNPPRFAKRPLGRILWFFQNFFPCEGLSLIHI